MENSRAECKSLEMLLDNLSNPLEYHQTIRSIEGRIGLRDDDTRMILNCLSSQQYKGSLLLSICSLILLENVDFDKTIALIKNVLDQCGKPEAANYIKLLQNSKFYLHRLAVPCLIKNRKIDSLKTYLQNAIEDTVEYVARTAILSLKDYKENLFSPEEIMGYANAVFESGSDYLEPNCVDLLLLVDFKAPLMDKLFVSDSWKIRLSLSKRLHLFKFDVKEMAIALSKDKEDEIRIVMAQNLDKFEDSVAKEMVSLMVNDPNPIVRSYCIEQICKSKEPLPENIIFESWEVTLTLLRSVNKRSNFEEIIFPIIKSLKDHKSWRVRKTIVDACYSILKETDDGKTKDIFFQFFFDKVSEVRAKASECLLELKGRIECKEYIEDILKSRNHKNRMAIIKYCVRMDECSGTSYVKELAKDGVSCVKIALLEELKSAKKLETDILMAINEMVTSKDEELSKMAFQFLRSINE